MTDPPEADHRENSSAAMGLVSRRHAVIGGLFAAASGIAIAAEPKPIYPPVQFENLAAWLPANIGPWSFASESGVLLPPPDALRDRLYDSLITRTYVAGNEPAVMLLLAYNNTQDGMLQIHRPEFCYPVGGFALSPTRQVAFSYGEHSIPANFFTATAADRVEQVCYFTRVGRAFPRTWLEQRMAVVRENLAGGIPDGVMLRVSLFSTESDYGLATLETFIQNCIEASAKPLQNLMVGRAIDQ